MAVKSKFEFKLKDKVCLESGEAGIVIGRAHFVDCNPQYRVRYKGGNGRMIESWWYESALQRA